MNPIRILAVDNEEVTLQMIQNTFHNYSITTETDFIKTLNIIEKNEFDIFLISHQVPGIDGIEILDTVKQNHTYPNVRIVCLPTGTVHIFNEELISGVFNLFLEKPYEIQDLKKIMKMAVQELEEMKGAKK